VCWLARVASSRAFGCQAFCIWGPTFLPRGSTSPLELILGFNYFHLCKNWIFDVIWPGRPFYDLKNIKGH
jgi:hypothetical protein